jgi:ABC-type transporter Mla MlaB component
MYLVSVFERDGLVEASLGGRVTADEIAVLAEEMADTLEEMSSKPFSLLLDYSRAKRMDPATMHALHELKDLAFEYGAVHITSIASDEGERTLHQTNRLQNVLEGRERYVVAGGELVVAAPAAAVLRAA